MIRYPISIGIGEPNGSDTDIYGNGNTTQHEGKTLYHTIAPSESRGVKIQLTDSRGIDPKVDRLDW